MHTSFRTWIKGWLAACFITLGHNVSASTSGTTTLWRTLNAMILRIISRLHSSCCARPLNRKIRPM